MLPRWLLAQFALTYWTGTFIDEIFYQHVERIIKFSKVAEKVVCDDSSYRNDCRRKFAPNT